MVKQDLSEIYPERVYDDSTPEVRKLVYYNFWNMELDEMIDELGKETGLN